MMIELTTEQRQALKECLEFAIAYQPAHWEDPLRVKPFMEHLLALTQQPTMELSLYELAKLCGFYGYIIDLIVAGRARFYIGAVIDARYAIIKRVFTGIESQEVTYEEWKAEIAVEQLKEAAGL